MIQYRKALLICLAVWAGLFLWMVNAVQAQTSGAASSTPPVPDRDFCLECHDADAAATLDASPHARQTCLSCHPKAAQTPHEDQPPVNCLACHQRHGENQAGDTHPLVTCSACHQRDAVPVKDGTTGRIDVQPAPGDGRPYQPHALTPAGLDSNCRRCHQAGNAFGAAAAILPAKSLICLPCHPAVFTVGDPVALTSLGLFLIGGLWLLSIFFLGGGSSEQPSAGRSVYGFGAVLNAVVFDVLLQRRLWNRSPGRWAIHGLIFYGMVFRLIWGLAAAIVFWLSPANGWAWNALDVNAPATALLFDLTGVMVLLGVLLAGFRRIRPNAQPLEGQPRPDRWALVLLGAAVGAGFIVEGVRMAMAGGPSGADYAFLGGALSRLAIGREGLTGLYPWLWYIHAGLWGAFVAYIPFSRMVHIILAPVVLIANAGRKH